MEAQPISQEQIAFNRKLKLFHGTEIALRFLYFNYRVSSYQLSGCQSITKKKKYLYIKRALGGARLSIKVIEASDELVNLDCIESSIVLSIDTDMCKQNLYLRALVI